jgi:hypothetical protein
MSAEKNTNPEENKFRRLGPKAPKLVDLLTLVEAGCWIVALFFASMALLCWSASILFKAFTNGPSFENAATTPATAVITNAIALMIVAISDIRLRFLLK